MNIMIATCFRTVAPPCWMGEREGKRARSTSLIVICVRFRPHFVRPCLRPSVRQAVGAEEAAGRPDGREGRRCAGKFSHRADNAAQMRSQSRSGCWLSLTPSLSSLSSPPPSISTSSHEVAFPLQKLAKCCLTNRKEEERPYIYYHSTPLS